MHYWSNIYPVLGNYKALVSAVEDWKLSEIDPFISPRGVVWIVKIS